MTTPPVVSCRDRLQANTRATSELSFNTNGAVIARLTPTYHPESGQADSYKLPLTAFDQAQADARYQREMARYAAMCHPANNFSAAELNEADIRSVMAQTQCSRKVVVKSLIRHRGDIVDAIIELSI